jgi:glucose-6-phosphate isomerase
MLTLDINNLETVYSSNDQHSLDLNSLNLGLPLNQADTIQRIISRKQGFLDLPNDLENLNKILDFTGKVDKNLENLVLVGIGGSSLGPKCIYQALGNHSAFKKVIIIDNIDPDEIYEVSSNLDYSKTLFLIVTKSGTTPETVATYLYFREKAKEHNVDITKHFVFITDSNKGYLREVSNQEGIPSFEIPDNVGGRFSVLSNVGLVFAALIGVDIKALLEGAADLNQQFLNQDKEGEIAWKLASIQYLLDQKGKNINVIMPYSSRLNSLGDWYTQLLSESIGKEFDLSGNVVNVGPTPLPALGATDQHSQLQLFKEGPHNKLIIFLYIQNFDQKVIIPEISDNNLKYLSNHTFQELIQAEYQATALSLTESNRPNITINLPQLDAYNLGQLFQLFELSVASLGEFYDIDTFNQPGVERGKVLTKEILQK